MCNFITDVRTLYFWPHLFLKGGLKGGLKVYFATLFSKV